MATQPRKDSPVPNEKSFPSGFISQGGTSAQTIQATVAHSPNWENPVNQVENSVPQATRGMLASTPPSLEYGVADKSVSAAASPYANADLHVTGHLSPALEGITATGFAGWGYQKPPQIGGPRAALLEQAELPSSFDNTTPPNPNAQPAESITSSGGPFGTTIRDLSAQIQRLGAVRYRLETWGTQGELFRFWCEMPLLGGNGAVVFFEAIAPRPDEAMENVVRQVENWLKGAETLNYRVSGFQRQN